MNTEIAIIGGGASGLAAAIEVRRLLPQAEVLVIERLDRVGKKILATGNGRCNLSNENISARNYHGSFMGAAEIIEHTPTAAAYFKNLGLLTAADSAGRIYPYSNAAASVLTALRLRAEEAWSKDVLWSICYRYQAFCRRLLYRLRKRRKNHRKTRNYSHRRLCRSAIWNRRRYAENSARNGV